MKIFYKQGSGQFFLDISGYIFMNGLEEKCYCGTYFDGKIFQIVC